MKATTTQSILILLFLLLGFVATTGVKSQYIRLLDIFFYGPFLIYLGLREEDTLISYTLLFLGATTISYNAKNFYYTWKRERFREVERTHPASW